MKWSRSTLSYANMKAMFNILDNIFLKICKQIQALILINRYSYRTVGAFKLYRVPVSLINNDGIGTGTC